MTFASCKFVAVARSMIPAARRASIRSRAGRPKWKLTIGGHSAKRTASFASSVKKDW
jgi:hypothetical protein